MAKPIAAIKPHQRKRLLVTIPDDVRKWLRERATFNGSTLSGEVVRAVRAAMTETR